MRLSDRHLPSVAVLLLAAGIVAVAIWREPLLARPFRAAPLVQSLAEPDDSAAFFGARNEVTIMVPRDMTMDEFIVVYRLEPVRNALRQRSDILRAGEAVTVPLTPWREGDRAKR